MAGWPLPRRAVPVALAILKAATPDIPGYDKIPEPRPAKFYVVSRAGGHQPNQKMDAPRILVECWAEDSDQAEDMTTDARQAFRNATGKHFGEAFIYYWDNEQGPVDFDDPDIKNRSRCQFFGDLYISTQTT